MALFLALALGSAQTWQDAMRAELADPGTATVLPVHQGDVGWFARANQERHFDAAMNSAVFNDDWLTKYWP